MRFKRILLLAMAACFALCGCNEAENSEGEISSSQAEITEQLDESQPADDDPLTSQVKIEKLDLGVSDVGMSEFFHTDNGYGIFLFPQTSFDVSFAEYSKDFELISDNQLTTPAPQDDYYYVGGLYVYSDEMLYSFSTMEWHNGMVPYALSDDKDNYDWETYNSEMDVHYMFSTYSMDGTLINAVPLVGYEEYFGDDAYATYQFYVDDGEAYLTLNTGKILHINKDDGSLTEIFCSEDVQEYDYIYMKLSRDRDGKNLLYIQREYPRKQEENNLLSVYEFDLENGICGTEIYSKETNIGDYVSWVDGFDEYRFCIIASDNLTGCKYNGEQEELIDWTKSNLQVSSVQLLGENRFVYTDWNESGTALKLLTRKRKSELNEKQILQLMVINSYSDVTDIVNEFNQSRSNCRIEVLENPAYSGEYEDEEAFEKASREFEMMLLTDDAPDIVLAMDSDTILKYGEKGVFTDIYTLMENDSKMNKSAFLSNVLTAHESENGALYGMPLSFKFKTLLIKSRFCDKENWTIDDMISAYDNAGNEYDIYRWFDRNRMLSLFLEGMDFVDEKNGTCSFNSDEFIDILKFCKRFPETIGYPEKQQYTEEELKLFNEFYINMERKYLNDEALINPMVMTSSTAIMGGYPELKASMNGEDVTFVGYPSDNGNGNRIEARDVMAVSTNCENKAAAWDFIKLSITEESSGIPVTEKEFKEDVNTWTELQGAFGASGLGYYEEPRSGIKIYPLTEEERDYLENAIRSTTTLISDTTSINDIINEEVSAYFADAKTAEETAEIIQNRAEILVSEQSW